MSAPDPTHNADTVRCDALIRLNGDQCPERAEWLTTQGKRLCNEHAFLVSNLGVVSLPIDGQEAPDGS